MIRQGRLIIITAPSGTGKTSVIRKLLSIHLQMVHSVSWTTRPIRPGEVKGRDYCFIDEEAFRKGIANDRFAEWAEVHGHFYGTPRGPLNEWLKEGRDVLLDVDVVGCLNLKREYGDVAISIFLAPPNMEELKRRLSSRGTDTPDVQALRLKNALLEMKAKDRFDYSVVNDDLDRACEDIERIVNPTPEEN